MSASADAPAVAGGVDAQRALSERAAALIELGRHREALPLLQRLIAQAPDHHYAHCLLASVFSGLDQPKQALEYAERAIHLDPQEPWAYYKRGLLLLDAGRKREALPALEQAVKLAPQDCDYLHALAVGQIVRGKTKLAAQAAERMAALAPDAALTHTTLARVKIIQKRWQEAEVHAKTAVRIDPGSASALAFLGLAIIMQRGREREGLDLIHRAIKLSPNDKIAKIALQEGMKIYLPKPSALGLLIAFAAPGVLVWLAIRYVIDTA
ncbi:MAG: tetratricopeptide repeat protein, partial [Gammaproteobacteria bacterium]